MRHAVFVLFCIVSFALCNEELTKDQRLAVRATVTDLVEDVMGACLVTEAIKGDPKEVGQLLRDGAPIAFIDELGRTPLHMALANNRYEVAWQLFAKNPPANTQDDAGRTPLMAVVYLPNDPKEALKVCKKLQSRGASFDLCDSSGMNALMLAARSCVFRKEAYEGLFEYLIQHTTNVDRQSKDGSTALHYAAKMGNTRAVEALLAKGADSTLRDGKGRTPCEVACLHRQEVAAVLAVSDLESGAE